MIRNYFILFFICSVQIALAQATNTNKQSINSGFNQQNAPTISYKGKVFTRYFINDKKTSVRRLTEALKSIDKVSYVNFREAVKNRNMGRYIQWTGAVTYLFVYSKKSLNIVGKAGWVLGGVGSVKQWIAAAEMRDVIDYYEMRKKRGQLKP